MIAPQTSMTRELDDLICQQIHTLAQDAQISDAELTKYQQRSLRIRMLCRTLNQESAQTCAGRRLKNT
jgi:hypothetical protein